MTVQLRPAEVSDIEDIVHLHMTCHEEAYGRLLPPDFFARRREMAPQRAARWRDGTVPLPLLAEDCGTLVGMAAAGQPRDEDAPATVELYLLYTLAMIHGTGVGQLLLDAALGCFPAAGATGTSEPAVGWRPENLSEGGRPAYLWVLEDNPRARAFYAKNGFVPDGARRSLPVEWQELPEMRLVRAAAPECR